MAVIKTSGGKVITKDGKPSCTCCDEGICEFGFENLTFQYLEITPEQYAMFRAGGTFEADVGVSGEVSINYSCANGGVWNGSIFADIQAEQTRTFGMLPQTCFNNFQLKGTPSNNVTTTGTSSLTFCQNGNTTYTANAFSGANPIELSVAIYSVGAPTPSGYALEVGFDWGCSSSVFQLTGPGGVPEAQIGGVSITVKSVETVAPVTQSQQATVITPLGNLNWTAYLAASSLGMPSAQFTKTTTITFSPSAP